MEVIGPAIVFFSDALAGSIKNIRSAEICRLAWSLGKSGVLLPISAYGDGWFAVISGEDLREKLERGEGDKDDKKSQSY